MANIGEGSLQQSRYNKSAALAKLEKEIKELRGENLRLKSEVSSIKCLYDQLVYETPHEQFSEKRVQLLKSQLHLLERQMEVQNQALQSRAQLLTDMVALLDYILDDICSKEMERGGEKMKQEGKLATQTKMDSLQEKAHTMKSRIFRSNQAYVSKATRLSFPHLPTSLLASPIDVCTCGHGLDTFSSDSIPASQLNLKYVSSLESELARLYGNLTQLQSCFQSLPLLPSPSSAPPISLSSLLAPLTDHQQQLVKVTSDLLANCCSHILSLSLLAPSSPTPLSTEDSTASGITDSLFTQLKPHIRNRKEVKEIVQEVAKSVDHAKLLQRHKTTALECELEFHRSVYQLQVDYISSLFEAVRKGYETFEADVQDVVCTPLDAILLAYSDFSKSREEDKLRIFLAEFQEREKSLTNVVKSLRASHQDKSGDILGPQGRKALSAFGDQFFKNLQKLEKECHDKRQLSCDQKLLNHPTHRSV